MKKIKQNNNFLRSRRELLLPLLGLFAGRFTSQAFGAGGAAGRVADRSRRRIAKRHSVVAYHRATARQRAVALQNARKAQDKLRRKWKAKHGRKKLAKPSIGSSSRRGGSTSKKSPNKGTIGRGSSSGQKATPTYASIKDVPMKVVLADLNQPNVQAVATTVTSPGARKAYMSVDLATGGLVGNGVVEMAGAPRIGSSISKQVKLAVKDGTIQGNPNEWLRTDVTLASL